MLAAGHLPLWNPYVFSGIPLLGDGQTAMFYPPNWLFFLLPGETALNLVVLLQFSIAGVGMFAFARTLGLWRIPAFVAALAYMFCGFTTARIVHLSIMSGAALDAGDLRLRRAAAPRQREKRGTMVCRDGGRARMPGDGRPSADTDLHGAGSRPLRGRPARWNCGASTGGWRRGIDAVLLVAAAYVLGYALAAVQLVPWVEFARLSTRAAGATYAFVFGTSTSGAEWLLFLFPYLLGAHESSFFATGPFAAAQAVRVWEHSAYVGVLPLALAARRPRALRRVDTPPSSSTWNRPQLHGGSAAASNRWYSLFFFLLLLVAGLLMAAGSHTPFGRAVYYLPVIGKLRAIERALVLAAFALAALAGFGLQRIVEQRDRRTWLLAPAVLIVAVPWMFVAHAYVRPSASLLGVPAPDVARLSLQFPHTWLPLLLATASAVLLAWWSRAPARPLTQAVAVALVVLDLGLYAITFTPTSPRRVYRVRPQVAAAWRDDRAPFRKATVLEESRGMGFRAAQQTLAMSWGMVHGVEDINGFNSLQPRRYTDYVFGRNVGDVSYGYLRDERLFRADSPILSSLNVRYVVVPAESRIALGPHLRPIFEGAYARVYQNALAYPRAYFADVVRADNDPRRVLRRVTAPGFDGRREAFVEAAAAPSLSPPRGAATAEASRSGPNALEVATATTEPRFLVVSEMYFPGWRAYVDGVEATIYRTNYLFRGVLVPAGRHTVRFEYRPTSVVVGAGMTALAALAAAWLLALGGGNGTARHDVRTPRASHEAGR